MNILFSEPDHRYFCPDKPDKKFTSVSKVFELVKQKFDAVAISEQYAKRGKDDILLDLAKKRGMTFLEAVEKWGHLEMTPEDIRQIWDDHRDSRLERGTAFHKFKEEQALKRKSFRGSEIQGEFTKAIDISNLAPGEYVELILPYVPLWIIGTADRVEILPDKSFIIRDWKGFPLDTEIPTPSGFTLMKDLKVNDEVFDGDGFITTVKNVSDIHYNPCYKITFDTNESIICDHEHRWEVYSGFGQTNNKKDIITSEEIFNYYTKQKKHKKLRIKNSLLTLPECSLPIDPYVLGCWLGDGNSYFGRLTNMNDKIWNEIKKRGYELGEDISKGQSGKAQDRTIKGLHTELKKLNLLGNKHIPEIYLRSSYKQRVDLLRGFMDTDGYFNRKRKRCVMETTKEWQANAIIELVSSLKYKATVFKTKTKGFNKNNVSAFQVWFTMDVNPFLCKNEDYLEVVKDVRFFNSEYRYIKTVEKVDTVPTKCIEVDSPNHTYLVGRTYLRTHNTDKSMEFESKKFYNPKKGIKEKKKLLAPLNHIDDVNGMHYNIKESMYIYILEYYGYKFKEGYIDHVIFDNRTDEAVNIVTYPITYMKKEIETLFKWYKTKNF